MILKGFPIDDQTRCRHYHSRLDIIAIRFRCCGDWYPCIHCHEEAAGHAAQRWPQQEREEKAVLCGVCRHELTINEYFKSGYRCPACGAAFNPKCAGHDHLYFETPARES